MKSLFRNIPLQYTTGLVLNTIFDNGELSRDITRSKMKEMLTPCTKNVHFPLIVTYSYKQMELLWISL